MFYLLSVSYFGESFCKIKATHDVTSFNLSLQFLTSKRSGLLFLAAGLSDHLLLELRDGHLQVHLELGSGEVVLTSESGLKLNNLVYHDVTITLKERLLTMVIDSFFSRSANLPDTQQDLGIDLGFYLGGTGNQERIPNLEGSAPPFRGCLSDIVFKFNDVDLLALEHEQSECHEITKGCSEEFQAGEGDSIRLVSPNSFVAFPTWNAQESRTLELLMKTTLEESLLLFHAGHQTDFITLGLVAGYLRGVVNQGSGAVILDNPFVQVADDQWHRVKIRIDPGSFEITVDSQASGVSLSGTESLDLKGNLYFGVLGKTVQDDLRNTGVLYHLGDVTTDDSFIGCLGDIKVNHEERSLWDVLISKDIQTTCNEEDYGDYSSSYDEESVVTPTLNSDDIQTTCNEEDYGDYSSAYDEESVVTPTPNSDVFEFIDVDPDEQHCHPTEDMPPVFWNVTRLLKISPLIVPEGGQAFLDLNNLQPTVDLNSIGIRQSQIVFTLQKDPWHGHMDLNVNNLNRRQKFTLLDVVNKKIKYIHDGSERYMDQLLFDVVAYSTGFLPECLATKRYTLPIQITPINDIPQLNGGDIWISEYTRTRLSSNFIRVEDADTRCEELKLFVTSGPSKEEGYLENRQQPGQSIEEFTCMELKDGDIYYVHKSGSFAQLNIQVSDGRSISQPATFNLSVRKPQMALETNTGLILSQGEASEIGIHNLAVSSTPQNGAIVYNVTKPLHFGELQKLENGEWKHVRSFHQEDLRQGHLRYFSTDSSDYSEVVVERVQFDVQLGHLLLRNNTFLIKIKPSRFKMEKLVPLVVEKGGQKAITLEELEAALKGQSVEYTSFQYMILKAPAKGSLLLLLDRELFEGDTFTQEDLRKARLNYKVRIRRAVEIEDEFQFQVFVDQQYSPVYTYPIRILADPDVPVLKNEGLTIIEGEEKVLTKDHLWLQSRNITHFVYRVIQNPQYGRLIRESPVGQPRFEGAVSVFSNEDLLLERLIYKHDGSESSEDEFAFLAFEQTKESSLVQALWQDSVKGVFKINIQSRNDHVPVRLVDKIFSVVRNGQRLLTTEDILFGDEDSDFNDSQLVYVRMGIPYGNIVSAQDNSQSLFRFTQGDLREKKVLFVHQGADRGRFQLQVSDGLHKTTALLEIQASDPYLQIANNTMIVVDQGGSKKLESTILSVESNMDIRDPKDIKYEVVVPPREGEITVHGQEAMSFSQDNLLKGMVSYHHSDKSLSSKDYFKFTVKANQVSVEGMFRIRIFREGYQLPPKVVRNELIYSFEGEPTEISQDLLTVEHADFPPSEVVYYIKEPPQQGHIIMLVNDSAATAAPSLYDTQSFTQEDINNGRVIYISKLGQQSDAFTVDVTNGITSVENIQVLLEIIPNMIPLQVKNIMLMEGGSKALNKDILSVSDQYYSSVNIDLIVDEPPRHGALRYPARDDYVVPFFTWNEVDQGLISYHHDGSDTEFDSFTLIALAAEIDRNSRPVTVNITIIPLDDDPPRVTVNTGLEIWPGETVAISQSVLSSEDRDTPAEDLKYSIEAPSNGRVALRSLPSNSIQSFSQAQINDGQVIFIQEGPLSGGFTFTVTDGTHTSAQVFNVTVRQLSIVMETKGELAVYPGTSKPITTQILKAVTNGVRVEALSEEITYHVLRAPRLGRLVSANQTMVSSFSQAELETGSIWYQQELPKEAFWISQDSIDFLLSAPPASELKHTLKISISFLEHNPSGSSQLWKNTGLNILEGEGTNIDRSKLDASNFLASLPMPLSASNDIAFEVTRFPAHGRLSLVGQALQLNFPYFLQEHIDRRELEYLHDGSDTEADSFTFQVWLKPREQGLGSQSQKGIVIEEAFNISIKPVNYNPPELVSQNLVLEVLQGSNNVLSQENLNTVDQDSLPNKIIFRITRGPTNGLLIDRDTNNIINMFTQADINSGQVAFVSDGSLSPGFMDFIISDGKHQTSSYTLNINVFSRNLTLIQAEEIHVKQGDTKTLITDNVLKVMVDSKKQQEVLYEITETPKYGTVVVDRLPVFQFSQREIDEGRVSYQFLNFTSHKDSFRFMVHSRAANVSGVLNFTVSPLVDLPEDLLWPRETTILVDTSILNASKLANRTESIPSYKITRQPSGARFLPFNSGKDENGTLNFFTQKDLEEGRIVLEIFSQTDVGDQVQNDTFQFILMANGVPPALGSLSFRTAPYNSSVIYDAILIKVPSSGTGDLEPEGRNLPWVEDSSLASPDTSRWGGTEDGAFKVHPTSRPVKAGTEKKQAIVSLENNILAIIIPICVIILLLIVAAILAYYLVRRNKTGKHDVQVISSKPKNGEVNQETFRKTNPAHSIPLSNMGPQVSKEGFQGNSGPPSGQLDPEILQYCRTTNPALKKNQYWV
ncbi:UNVERIFIED_CONTAM: hypothetical protein FKN15_006743 [Acipenser sinensis]